MLLIMLLCLISFIVMVFIAIHKLSDVQVLADVDKIAEEARKWKAFWGSQTRYDYYRGSSNSRKKKTDGVTAEKSEQTLWTR